MTTADELRHWVEAFPAGSVLMARELMLRAADELERLTAENERLKSDMLEAATRIGKQSELLSKRAARPDGIDELLRRLDSSGGIGRAARFLRSIFKESVK